jgi:sugar phosphate isomerase/epimerase
MHQFTLSAFGDEISADLDEQIQVLKHHQISHLECRNIDWQVIIDYPLDQVKAFSHRLQEQDIAVSAIGSPIGKILVTDEFEPHLERFKKTIEVAHAMQTGYIRMFSFFMPEGQPPALYRQAVLDRWAKFIEAASGSGLILLHENEKGIYGDTAERCLDLLHSLACPWVKATFDPANFVQCGVQPYPDAFQLLHQHIAYMHIKDAREKDHMVVPAGEGDGHVAEILSALAQSGFQGFLSIEPHLNNNLPGGGPERFAVAVAALKNIIARI